MAKYIFLAMRRNNARGYQRGDIVSIRPPGSKVTEIEEKLFIVIERECTPEEVEEFATNLRPRAKFQYAGSLPEKPTKVQADEHSALSMAARRDIPFHGVKLDLNHPDVSINAAALNNPSKKVPKFLVAKEAISLKE